MRPDHRHRPPERSRAGRRDAQAFAVVDQRRSGRGQIVAVRAHNSSFPRIEDAARIERPLQGPQLPHSLAQLAAEEHLPRGADAGMVRDGGSRVSRGGQGRSGRRLEALLGFFQVRRSLRVSPVRGADVTDERDLDGAALPRRVVEVRAHQREALRRGADRLVQRLGAIPGGGQVQRLTKAPAAKSGACRQSALCMEASQRSAGAAPRSSPRSRRQMASAASPSSAASSSESASKPSTTSEDAAKASTNRLSTSGALRASFSASVCAPSASHFSGWGTWTGSAWESSVSRGSWRRTMAGRNPARSASRTAASASPSESKRSARSHRLAGARPDAQPGLGEDGQRAFASQEELGQIGSGAGSVERPQDLAGAVHRGEREDHVRHWTVSRREQSGAARGEPPTHRRGPERRRSVAQGQPLLGEQLVQALSVHTRAGVHRAFSASMRKRADEPLGVEHDPAAHGDRASRRSTVPAADRDHGDLPLRGETHQGGDLLGRSPAKPPRQAGKERSAPASRAWRQGEQSREAAQRSTLSQEVAMSRVAISRRSALPLAVALGNRPVTKPSSPMTPRVAIEFQPRPLKAA